MKNALIAFRFALLGTTSAQAAIVSWSAGSNLSLDTSYDGGYAYFLEVKDGGPDLTQLISSIEQNGLQGENSNVALLGQDALFSESGYVTGEGVVFDSPITENATSTYYTLFVNADKTTFVFSDGTKVIEWSANGWATTFPDGSVQYDLTVFEEADDGWLQNGGTVGGGTIEPDVPEPTALALLALGVAGVALRRRVA